MRKYFIILILFVFLNLCYHASSKKLERNNELDVFEKNGLQKRQSEEDDEDDDGDDSGGGEPEKGGEKDGDKSGGGGKEGSGSPAGSDSGGGGKSGGSKSNKYFFYIFKY
jgi:hypothetical protein